jgi:Protein of unknown function (DUF751)
MNFWNNILRYPRFFISSIIGLVLVLINSVLKTFKTVPDKRILLFILLFCFGILTLVLNLMLNLDYY